MSIIRYGAMGNELSVIEQPTKLEVGQWYTLQVAFSPAAETEISPKMIADAISNLVGPSGHVDEMRIAKLP